MTRTTNRRDFLKASAVAGIGVWVATRDAYAEDAPARPKSPNDQINIACVGVGGKGESDSNHAGKYGNVVALCDVDATYLAKQAEVFPKARTFSDYRQMFDAMGKEIDAVTVSTPDHNHAAASMLAIRSGKHVYCQKPLTHTIAEARALRDAARQYKVATQMGNQGASQDEFRRGVEILRAGTLGAVKEVHLWTDRPIWPQAPDILGRPKETPPVPSTLNWDAWIGPAPMRPYSPEYHPFKWRGWWDFGSGALGDMGCHTANLPFMGLELGYPQSVSGVAGDLNPETCPSWATVTYQFPARGDRAPVKLVWWEGHRRDKDKKFRNLPSAKITRGIELPPSGSLMIGENGLMYSFNDYGGKIRLMFDVDSTGFTPPPKTLPRIGGGDDTHKLEWINAARGGPPGLSNFDYASQLTEMLLLGVIAIRTGQKLEWDGPNMKVTNLADAGQYLQTEYRQGWTL